MGRLAYPTAEVTVIHGLRSMLPRPTVWGEAQLRVIPLVVMVAVLVVQTRLTLPARGLVGAVLPARTPTQAELLLPGEAWEELAG